MTFQYQGGGIIEGCLAFYAYETPKAAVNQKSVTVSGKFKSNVIHFVEEKLYILDWIFQGDRVFVMESVYNVNTNESKIDPGYFLSDGPKWELATNSHTLPIWNATLKFRKG